MSYYIPDMLHRPGALVEGRYRLMTMVSRSRLSVVYRGRDERFRKDVAVKIVPGIAAAVDANRVGRVRDPSVIQVVDVAPVGPEHTAIVMEWVEGTQLGTWLKSGPLPEETALDVFEQLASALVAAHGQRVVHGVIQPSNVVLAQSDEGATTAKLAGLDRLIVSLPLTEVTEPPEGAPRYTAPELEYAPTAEPAADIFALGATMWHAFSGQPKSVVPSSGRASIRVPVTIQIGGDVRRVLERCLKADPRERYASAAELLAAVRALRTPVSNGWWTSPYVRIAATFFVACIGVALLGLLVLLLREAGVLGGGLAGVAPGLAEGELPGLELPNDGEDAEVGPRTTTRSTVRATVGSSDGEQAGGAVESVVPPALEPGRSLDSGQVSQSEGGSANSPAAPNPLVRTPPSTRPRPSVSDQGQPSPEVEGGVGSAVADSLVSGGSLLPTGAVEPPTATVAPETPATGSHPVEPGGANGVGLLPALSGTTRWVGELGGRPTEWSLKITPDGRVVGTSRTRFGADWVYQTLSGEVVEEVGNVRISMVETGGKRGTTMAGVLGGSEGTGSLLVNGRRRASWTMRRQ